MSKLDESLALTESCIDLYAEYSVSFSELTERQLKEKIATQLGISLRSVAQRLSKNNITDKFVRYDVKDDVLKKLEDIGFSKDIMPNLIKLTKKELEFLYNKFTS